MWLPVCVLWALSSSSVIQPSEAITTCDLSSITDDSETTITMKTCSLTSFDQLSLKRFHQLVELSLLSNKLTSFPNVTVTGSSLTILLLGNNKISWVNPLMLEGLVMLEKLGLSGNKLHSFPDVRPVAQTLKTLFLGDNFISTIDANLLTSLHGLELLKMDNNPLVTFPSVPIGLQKITLKNTQLSSISPVILGTKTSLDIVIKSTNINLCHCKNVWLKLLPALGYDDVLCSGSTAWSISTIAQLKSSCTHQDPMSRSSIFAPDANNMALTMYGYLDHTLHSSTDQFTCSQLCLETPGCVLYFWRPQGECVITSPSENPNFITEGDSPIWSRYPMD